MDNFAEQLVKKNETSSDKTRRVMVIVVGALLTLTLAALAILQLRNPILSLLGLVLAPIITYRIPTLSTSILSPTASLTWIR